MTEELPVSTPWVLRQLLLSQSQLLVTPKSLGGILESSVVLKFELATRNDHTIPLQNLMYNTYQKSQARY